jgi:hypothetical protein
MPAMRRVPAVSCYVSIASELTASVLATVAIASALTDNVVLESLLLEGNPVGDGGVAALVAALRAHSPGRQSALVRLGLARTNLTDTGCASLLGLLQDDVAIVPRLEVVTMDGNPAISRTMHERVQEELRRRVPSSQSLGGIAIGALRTSVAMTGLFDAAQESNPGGEAPGIPFLERR